MLLCLAGCTNDNDGTTGSLPEKTTTGKNTFGCTVDGVNFVPKKKNGFSIYYTPELVTRYFKVDWQDSSFKKGFYLQIYAFNLITEKDIVIQLNGSDEPLVEGKTYKITTENFGSFSARYSFSTQKQDEKYSNVYYVTHHDYKTSDNYVGELTITKLDEKNLIIAGTFWFEGMYGADQTTTKIQDGRFDLKYTPYIN